LAFAQHHHKIGIIGNNRNPKIQKLASQAMAYSQHLKLASQAAIEIQKSKNWHNIS